MPEFDVVTPEYDGNGRLLVVYAYCCTKWPCLALTPMGKCGYCQEVPVVR